MKLFLSLLLIWTLEAHAQGYESSTSTRSVYLNGVDISSAKNQALQQVNLRIDAQGNIYIEAPHYDIQRETSFLPLGRQLPGQPRHLDHKPPAALNHNSNSPTSGETKPNLASPSETGDTLKQGLPSTGDSIPNRKEGTRTPPDGSEDRRNSGPEIPTNPG